MSEPLPNPHVDLNNARNLPKESAFPIKQIVADDASTVWLEALQWHIKYLKECEENCGREIDEAQTKYQTIMKERIELENLIDKAQRQIEKL